MVGLICAFDIHSKSQSLLLSEKIINHIDMIKIGWEFFATHSVDDVRNFSKQVPLFLDFKLHDIPNTVEKAVEGLLQFNPAFITVHASGGPRMIEAAVKPIKKEGLKTKILAVTVLTSLSAEECKDIGFTRPLSEQVIHLAKTSVEAGAGGIVCSALEAKSIKESLNHTIDIVCPGIRLHDHNVNDQTRIVTPKIAAESGANYIVVGRPIVKADNPVEAITRIREDILLAG